MADRPKQLTHGPGYSQPLLADALRGRNRQNHRRLRLAGRTAESSPTVGLACRAVHGIGLGRQSDSENDRDERDLPAVVKSDPELSATGSGKPLLGAGTAIPASCGDNPGFRVGNQRIVDGKNRRPFGVTFS